MTEKPQKKALKKLTAKQLSVIESLFETDGDDAEVIAKNGISARLFRKWLGEKAFADELAFKAGWEQKKSLILLAKYIPFAATRLIELCHSEKEETARKACLDILSMPRENLQNSSSKGDEQNENENPLPAELSQQTCSKLLEVLAEERKQK